MAATSWSGLFDGLGNSVGGRYFPIDNKAPQRSRARQLVNREQYRALTALYNALIGAVVGANVTATHARIAGPNMNDSATLGDSPLGGLRQIETVTDINRNTTAADVTALKEINYNVQRRPVPYVPDLSGNGGRALA